MRDALRRMLAKIFAGVLQLKTGKVLDVVLEQVVEYLVGAQVILAEGPGHGADDLFTLVTESFSHIYQLPPLELLCPVFNLLILEVVFEES